MTASGADAHWDPFSFPLECSLFSGSHTAARILARTEELLANNCIKPEQVSDIVMDNAANAKLAGEMAPFDSMPCAAHTLQLTVKKVLDDTDIAELLRKVRKIVGAFKHSALKVGELRDEQKALDMKQRKPVQDVKTRWNSVYMMIKFFVDNKEAVARVCFKHRQQAGKPPKRQRHSGYIKYLNTINRINK